MGALALVGRGQQSPPSLRPPRPAALPLAARPRSFRLDYSGIALLIMGSFVPWLYYSFYCSPQPRLIYLSIVCVLGISAIIVAQWDRFATPKHRQTRAGGSQGRAPGGVSTWSLRGQPWAPTQTLTCV